jgi:hypothetical protein
VNFNDNFSLSVVGRIYLAASLPSEEKVYTLQVTATDGGGLTSQSPAQVYISITGQNSHPPVFDHLTYSFSVPENTVHGTTVGTIRATVQPVNGVTPGKALPISQRPVAVNIADIDFCSWIYNSINLNTAFVTHCIKR